MIIVLILIMTVLITVTEININVFKMFFDFQLRLILNDVESACEMLSDEI